MDGNGRMGRLWQAKILMEEFPVFEFLPIETIVKEKQEQYYDALSKSDKEGESTLFIEFMLHVINESLEEFIGVQSIRIRPMDRLESQKPDQK